MRLYFIRHAQSINNALWEQIGSNKLRNPDPEITDTGREQARLLAQFLQHQQGQNQSDYHNFELTHLYTSPMIRAILTGQAIAQALHKPLTVWTDLHELGGIYQDDEETGQPIGLAGHSRAYLQTRFPDLLFPEEFPQDGWWNRPYETKEDIVSRTLRFIHTLFARHGQSEDSLAVVAHAGFGQMLFAHLFNFSRQSEHLGSPIRFGFGIHNASMSRIDFRGERVGLVYLNRLDFLPPHLIT